MEGEDMLSIKVSSHLVQVYDTGILVPDLGRSRLGRISLVRERVTHPCPAESKMGGQEAGGKSKLLSDPGTAREPDDQRSNLSQLKTRQEAEDNWPSRRVPNIRRDPR